MPIGLVIVVFLSWNCEDTIHSLFIHKIALELKTGLLELLAKPLQNICSLRRKRHLMKNSLICNRSRNNHCVRDTGCIS